MTMENSPRATSAVPARRRPGTPLVRRAAIQPVAILVATVTTRSSAATPSTSGIAATSIWMPNSTKKRAANTSRSGLSSSRARAASEPEMERPTRKATTAEDTLSSSATPPTRSSRPTTVSSTTSLLGCASPRLRMWPCRRATASATTASPTAATASPMPRHALPPASSTATSGRYGAMARSSITSTESTAGVSELPRRPKSSSTLATMLDDEM